MRTLSTKEAYTQDLFHTQHFAHADKLDILENMRHIGHIC